MSNLATKYTKVFHMNNYERRQYSLGRKRCQLG